MFTVGAFGIILDQENRALLCHRRDFDLWNLPGGHVEKYESPSEAVVREIKEETGVDARIQRLSGVYSKPDVNQIIFVFICQIIGGEFTLTDEADKIQFYNIDKLPKKISPNHVERIMDALKQETTIYKVQKNYNHEALKKL